MHSLSLSGPDDIGHDELIKFDHDFIDREALGQPEEGANDLPITMPLAASACLYSDNVPDTESKSIGLSHHPGYSVNEPAMMSLGSTDEAYAAEPRTKVVLMWGEDSSGKRSKSWIKPHEQVRIRATAAPSNISRAAQQYRSVIGVSRGAPTPVVAAI